jgi:hypothetical protein
MMTLTQERRRLLLTVGETLFWSLALFLMMTPEVWAQMPIPGWTRMVTDTQTALTNQGGLIMGVGGAGVSAFKMVFSGGEFGMGNLIRTGAGCAVAGSAPALAPYFAA